MPKSTLYRTKCQIDRVIQVDSIYAERETDADLILFIGHSHDPNSNYNAYASFCLQHGSTGRPMVGYMIFNSAKISIQQQTLEFNLNVTAHELLHVLGFNRLLFPYFPKNSAGEEVLFKNSQDQYFLRGDAVVAEAKAHFGCDSLSMVPLEDEEDEATRGNHFESSVFGYEIMVPSAKVGYRISRLTLAVLRDSGWYQSNQV